MSRSFGRSSIKRVTNARNATHAHPLGAIEASELHRVEQIEVARAGVDRDASHGKVIRFMSVSRGLWALQVASPCALSPLLFCNPFPPRNASVKAHTRSGRDKNTRAHGDRPIKYLKGLFAKESIEGRRAVRVVQRDGFLRCR